jgi:hypothetical protein
MRLGANSKISSDIRLKRYLGITGRTISDGRSREI